MAHQHDRALVARLVVEADVDGIAEALVRPRASVSRPCSWKKRMKRAPTASTPALS
jgi:hypothetical protein